MIHESQFFLSSMWVLGISLRSSGLATYIFIRWAISLAHHNFFILSSIVKYSMILSVFLAIINNAITNVRIQMSHQDIDFIFPWYRFCNNIIVWNESSLFRFLRNIPSICHKVYSNIHSYQQYTGFPFLISLFSSYYI